MARVVRAGLARLNAIGRAADAERDPDSRLNQREHGKRTAPTSTLGRPYKAAWYTSRATSVGSRASRIAGTLFISTGTEAKFTAIVEQLEANRATEDVKDYARKFLLELDFEHFQRMKHA